MSVHNQHFNQLDHITIIWYHAISLTHPNAHSWVVLSSVIVRDERHHSLAESHSYIQRKHIRLHYYSVCGKLYISVACGEVVLYYRGDICKEGGYCRR